MGDDITIGVTEIVNNIEVTAQPNDQIVDISVIDNADDVTLNITPTVIEINVNKGSSYAKWGTILGTLSDQTDLQNALDLKANLVGGKVPASELPSYVDDVVEVADYAALPATGETGKIYVTLDNNKIYRWSGSVYIEIAANSAIWGAITGTLSSQTDLQNALNAKFDDPTGDTTQYIAGDGSLITFPIAGQAGTLVRQVRNTTGATLTKGTIVYINGANGNKPTIAKAIATGDSTSAQTFGMLQADISNNANGYVVCVGDIIGLDTSAITEGTQLYLSSTTAGAYTTTKQVAPAHLVYIGVVTRSHPTLGQIEVKIQNGYELDEIHDVLITSKTDKDFLNYDSASGLWKNKSLGTVLAGTSSQFVKGDGSLDSNTYALTSQLHNAVTIGTANGLSLSTQVLSLGLASTSLNGALSSTDWNTFNGKQAALNGTGFVKISGTTISYDNSTYALDSAVVKLAGAQTIAGVKTFSNMPILSAASGVDGQIVYADASNQLKTITNFKYNDATGVLTTQLGSLGSNAYTSTAYVPTSRTLTINGTAYDLTADRSWTINALPSMLEYNDTDKTIWNNGKNNIATNTSFGDGALKTNTSGAYNTAFGVSALNLNTTGSANTAVSTYTLSNNTSGYNNTGIGYESLLTNTTGYDNTGVGADALVNNLGGNSNSAVGYGALSSNTSGISNSSIGKYALGANTTGNYNVGIGDNAGNATLGGGTLNTTSSQSTYIGAFASCSANGVTNEIAIGYASSGNGSNSVTLGNTSITKTILRGSVGIGTTSPAAKLSISYSSATADALNIVNTNTNGRSWYVGDGAGLGAGNFGFYDATAGASRLVITSGGNVLIGTTSDAGYKLDVNGTFRASLSYAPQYAPKDSNGTSFISYYDGLPNFSSQSFLIYNAPDSPTAGGMWTITMVKWFADYGSMTALNVEPGTQKLYVKTKYGGSWSSWVEK